MVITFLKNHTFKNIWPISVMFFLFLAIAYFCFPFSVHLSHDSEIYLPYTVYINGGIIPGIHNGDINNFSLVFILGYFFHNFFNVDGRLYLYFFRMFFFISLSFGFFDLVLNFSKKFISKLEYRNIFLITATLIYIFDWNNSYLLIGDEFKSFSAQVFYLFFLNAIFESKFKKAIVFLVGVIFSHWAYGILLALNVFAYIVARYIKLSKIKLLLIPIAALLLAYIYKESFFYISPYHYWYLNTSHVKKGLLEGFLLRPGVLIATIPCIVSTVLAYRNIDKINNNFFIKFCTFMFLILFGFSKYGVVFSTGFIEPARNYILLSPFLAILTAYLICELSPAKIGFVVGIFLTANFILRNFAKGAIAFWEILSKESFEVLRNFIIHEHQELICIWGLFLLIGSFIFYILKYKTREVFI